jgi:maleate isomerase
MRDTLGWRRVYGVVTPSTNTVVQPEYDSMRPPGVTNHIARMHIPDEPVRSDRDFDELIRRIDMALEEAVDRVVTCRPDHLVLGISAESVWGGGLEPSRRIAERIRARAGDLPITQAADALPAAFEALGVGRRIGLLTPYFPVAEKHLKEFFAAFGVTVERAVHLSCTGPVEIGQTSEQELIRALRRLDGSDLDAIVQFGANLPMGRVAAEAERWLEKPVLAVNTVTYWHALRSGGIADRIHGFGRLLWEH